MCKEELHSFPITKEYAEKSKVGLYIRKGGVSIMKKYTSCS